MKRRTLLLSWILLFELLIGFKTTPAIAIDIFDDDVLVHGNICLGNNCSGGDALNFQDSVLRFRDTNNQIEFFDTSDGEEGFPSADWRFTFNDTNQGGDDFFKVTVLPDGEASWIEVLNIDDSALPFAFNIIGDNIGFGVQEPKASLHVSRGGDTFPQLLLNHNRDEFWLEVDTEGLNFYTSDVFSDSRQRVLFVDRFATADTLTLNSNGKVGVNIADPEGFLHVESTNANTQSRPSLLLAAPGQVIQKLRNSESGIEWTSGMFNDDLYFISSGLTFMAMNRNGEFGIIRNGLMSMLVGSGGDLFLSGTLSEGSSKDIKNRFEDLNPTEVLAKVASLPVKKWKYTHDDESVRHIGPFAEDFYSVFNVGKDNKHIRPGDVSGVALLAIQALKNNVEEKQDTIDALEAKIENLEAVVAEIQKKLAVEASNAR